MRSWVTKSGKTVYAGSPGAPDVPWPCQDCGRDTTEANERYTLIRETWNGELGLSYGSGYLCVGCVEERLGRKLVPDDFIPEYVAAIARRAERGDPYPMSKRLAARLA